MSDNPIDDDIEIKDEKDSDTQNLKVGFPDAIKELGKALNKSYPDRTGKITAENEMGLLQIDILNSYMKTTYDYEFELLKTLSRQKIKRSVSVGGFGIEKLIEIVKGIQLAFEQTDLPTSLRGLVKR